MNYILYVHDTDEPLVWDPLVLGVRGAVDAVQSEIGELVESYTMGRVTVDAIPDAIAEDFGGHAFQVMCSRCLDEPFDAAEECPEIDDNEVVDEGDEEP